MKQMNKKGLAGEAIAGIIGLVFLVVIGFVMVTQITGSNLLTTNSAEYNASTNLSANLATGVQTIATKIPTFFTIIAAVLILGFVLILWAQYKKSGMGSSGGTL